MKGAKKPRRNEKKVAQKTQKEKRADKRAASAEQARDVRIGS
jgi:hypothetical protein